MQGLAAVKKTVAALVAKLPTSYFLGSVETLSNGSHHLVSNNRARVTPRKKPKELNSYNSRGGGSKQVDTKVSAGRDSKNTIEREVSGRHTSKNSEASLMFF